MNQATDSASAERRKILSGCIKLLVTIGLLFLLVPFIKSLPWPEEKIPEDSTLLESSRLVPSVPQDVTLKDGSHVFVTRLDAAGHRRLQEAPAESFWYESAPGLLDQEYLVVQARTSLDEPVSWLPPQGNWPGGFIAGSGAAWDLAGRALKPFAGHPGGSAMKVSNLVPAPWRKHESGLLLMPLPAATPALGNEIGTGN